MAKYGMMGIPFPTEYGGAGGDEVSYAITVEELSRVCASTGVIVSAHTSLCCWPIYAYGTEEQKQKYLPDLLSGRKIGAFGLTEPNAGTDAAGQQTRAVLDGDEWVLDGAKVFITNGGYASTFVVMAMTDKKKGTHGGISSFIVEKGDPGFSIGKTEDKMGIHASSTTELIFQNCRIPKDRLLGEVGDGFKIALSTLDGGRIGIASPARLLVYKAAFLEDQHAKYGEAAAMAKLFAAETAMKVTTKCVQFHGGYGYTADYPVERMMRDAKITEIYEGTSEVQKIVIAANTFGK